MLCLLRALFYLCISYGTGCFFAATNKEWNVLVVRAEDWDPGTHGSDAYGSWPHLVTSLP